VPTYDPASSPKIAPLEKFLACVHCGLCLSACPTYVETGAEADSPRGRIYLMKAVEEGRLGLSDGVVRHLDLCLGCRACETACPSGVEYGLLIEGARSHLAKHAPRSAFDRWRRRRLATLLPDPIRLASYAALLRLADRLGVARLSRVGWMPTGFRRLAALVPTAAPARKLPAVLEPEGASRGTVALLTGCVAGAVFSHVNDLTARLLAAAGYRVIVPRGQVCCGALSAHLGEEEDTVRLARRNTNAFLRSEPDWIVTNAAGCGAMMREYGRWIGADPLYTHAARSLSAKVRDVTELLVAGSLPPPQHELRARVAYHDACHLAHGQGVRRQPRELLRAIPGLELVELGDSELCCGSAGTYNLTEPEMAWRLGSRKAASVLESGAEIVAAGNPGCILQIRAALRLAGHDLPVLHPVEILARAYGMQ
jgi:glycolate dehydrogenase iron-sulfur subunit